MRWVFGMALASALAADGAAAASIGGVAPGRAAIFGITFLDTSTEGAVDGVRDDQTQRIAMLEARMAEAFAEKGWTIVPTDAVAADLAKVTNIAQCNGCDGVLAQRLGADIAVTGEVQKVSNLILTINVIVRQAGTEDRLLSLGNADIRGNTDDSWLRGLNYILKNRIFRDQ